MRTLGHCFSLVLLLALAPAPAQAEWPRDPAVNLLLRDGSEYRNTPRACPDGEGGAWVIWIDYERTPDCHCDIYTDVAVQHVDRDGNPRFSDLLSQGDASGHALTPDGQGGVFVVWHEGIDHDDDPGLYVQRVTPEGPAWGRFRVTPDTADVVSAPLVVGDGQGGALIAWVERRSEYDGEAPYVYAQRIDANGEIRWRPGGTLIAEVNATMSNPSLAASGDGGALIAWEDDRSDAGDVFIQKLDAFWGWPAWPRHYEDSPYVEGVRVAAISGRAQRKPIVTSDGAGGACVVWRDEYAGESLLQVSRFSNLGFPMWENVGVGSAQIESEVSAVPDGGGGVVVGWKSAYEGSPLVARRVTGSGQRSWGDYGTTLCSSVSQPSDLMVVTDGSGGILASWVDRRTGSEDVWAQRVTAHGAIWADDGVAISIAADNQLRPNLTADGRGGAIVVFDDARTDYSRAVYAQRVDRTGHLGDPAPAIVSVADVPHDQGGQVRLSWQASYLDADPLYTVASYWIWRAIPEAAALARPIAPAPVSDTDGGPSHFSPGAIERTIDQGQTLYWELLAQQPASADAGYSMVVATPEDSSGITPALLSYRVQARHRDGVSFWNSATRTGSSTDDLAPPAPAAFTATVDGGMLRLHWKPSVAPDFSAYRLYAGDSHDFVPGPNHFVATVPDTGYATSVSYQVFKLTAVDARGNESAPSIVLARSVVSAPMREAVAFDVRTGPNPVRHRLEIVLSLSSPSDVRLDVFDLVGRKVRTLDRGRRGAGAHTIEWLGDDTHGQTVANGAYFLRVETETERVARRIVVSR